jgi:hypothetical protein
MFQRYSSGGLIVWLFVKTNKLCWGVGVGGVCSSFIPKVFPKYVSNNTSFLIPYSFGHGSHAIHINYIRKHDKICFYFGEGKHIYVFMFGVSSIPKTLVMVPSYGLSSKYI